jgi:subtilisin family serine protease
MYFPNLGVALGIVDRDGLIALEQDPGIAGVSAAPDLRLIRPTKKQGIQPTRGLTWGLGALDIPELWKQGLTGEGVVVAHLDTGLDGGHPTLDGAVAAFVEIDRLGREVPGATAFDTDDHGTHTAGTIAGRHVKDEIRIGVAPSAHLASAIVIEGGNTPARVLSGLNWAIGQRARILSMSLGLPGYVADFVPIVRILRERGLVPVIAVGNEGPGTSRSPGNYVEALSVGWSNEDGTVDPESSSQRFPREDEPGVPDMVAPGGEVISAAPGDEYQIMSGSSMATPHVAGLAALLIEADDSASVAELERALFSSCRPLPSVDPERQGLGLPNGPRALKALLDR